MYQLYSNFVVVKSGTADELIAWLQAEKKKNSLDHLVGKVVQFDYRKDAWSQKETKTVRVEEVNGGLLRGHDLNVGYDGNSYRSYRTDRVLGQIRPLN